MLILRRPRRALAPALLLLLAPLGAAGEPGGPGRHGRRDTLVQFGTLDQLNRAVLDGSTTVREIERRGDFGLGTFNALDGEMIVLDGVVYRFNAEGVLSAAAKGDLSPFAAVTTFHPEQRHRITTALPTLDALETFLNGVLPDDTRMVAIRIHGTFPVIKTRAPRRQTAPYPGLAAAVKTQAEFTTSHVRGTLVGFRLPPYLGTANATGYHLHFVSDDHRAAGHVLEVATDSGDLAVQTLDHLELDIPQDAD
jgi:acetolactate decarboxylase